MKHLSSSLLCVVLASVPRFAEALHLGGDVAVQGGYSTAIPLGAGSVGVHGGGIMAEGGLRIAAHFLGIRGAFQQLYRDSDTDYPHQAMAFSLRYSYTWAFLGERITLTTGVGLGVGAYSGCLLGDYCGGGGFEWNASVSVGYRVLPWFSIELVNDFAFQGGMVNGVDVVMMYSPMAALRVSLGR